MTSDQMLALMEPQKNSFCTQCNHQKVPETIIGPNGYCVVLMCPVCGDHEIISVHIVPEE